MKGSGRATAALVLNCQEFPWQRLENHGFGQCPMIKNETLFIIDIRYSIPMVSNWKTKLNPSKKMGMNPCLYYFGGGLVRGRRDYSWFPYSFTLSASAAQSSWDGEPVVLWCPFHTWSAPPICAAKKHPIWLITPPSPRRSLSLELAAAWGSPAGIEQAYTTKVTR